MTGAEPTGQYTRLKQRGAPRPIRTGVVLSYLGRVSDFDTGHQGVKSGAKRSSGKVGTSEELALTYQINTLPNPT